MITLFFFLRMHTYTPGEDVMAWICLRIKKDFQKKFEPDLGKNMTVRNVDNLGRSALETGLEEGWDWYPLQP